MDNSVQEARLINEQNQFAKRRRRLGPKCQEADSISERFRRFHSANPEVYRNLVNLARQLKRSGRDSYGIVGLYEVLRYDASLKTDGKPFKLSNDYRSRYARLIMAQEPDLEGFFKTRELSSI